MTYDQDVSFRSILNHNSSGHAADIKSESVHTFEQKFGLLDC